MISFHFIGAIIWLMVFWSYCWHRSADTAKLRGEIHDVAFPQGRYLTEALFGSCLLVVVWELITICMAIVGFVIFVKRMIRAIQES